MIRVILLHALIASVVIAAADPLLSVRISNPWNYVVGSDSASFVIYDDGLQVFLRLDPNANTPFAQKNIKEPEKLARELLGFDVKRLAGNYTLSSATDQITTTIWTPTSTMEIYGDWRKPEFQDQKDDPTWKEIAARELKMWQSLPTEIRNCLLRIEEARKETAADWLPHEIEVMLWPYEYAPDESIPWPNGWADLNSETTMKRGGGGFSVFIPSGSFTDLKRFIASRKEKGAVLINGKKMAIAYRFPIPGESRWMR